MKKSLIKGLSLVPVLAGCALACLIVTAQAQLSSAQQSALKSNCRSDFMSHCSGVTPGGKEALGCLQKKVASLSPACQQVVKSTLPPPPEPAQAAPALAKPAAAPSPAPPAAVAAPPQQAAPAPTAAQQEVMRANCRNDFMAHCSGVSPGGKDALSCLQKNAASLSAACQKAVGATVSAPPASPPRAAPPPARATKTAPPPKPAPPPAAAAAATPSAPTAAQQNAMKANCRNDFMAHCGGVSPGGKEAFGCLQQNVARLSAACKEVVSATLGEPPAAGAADAPVAITPPPAAPESGPFVPGAALILKACARDLLMNCRGIAGDGKAVACLKTHAQNGGRLGIRCRAALNVTSKLR